MFHVDFVIRELSCDTYHKFFKVYIYLQGYVYESKSTYMYRCDVFEVSFVAVAVVVIRVCIFYYSYKLNRCIFFAVSNVKHKNAFLHSEANFVVSNSAAQNKTRTVST